jgi:hypothetical protein
MLKTKGISRQGCVRSYVTMVDTVLYIWPTLVGTQPSRRLGSHQTSGSALCDPHKQACMLRRRGKCQWQGISLLAMCDQVRASASLSGSFKLSRSYAQVRCAMHRSRSWVSLYAEVAWRDGGRTAAEASIEKARVIKIQNAMVV